MLCSACSKACEDRQLVAQYQAKADMLIKIGKVLPCQVVNPPRWYTNNGPCLTASCPDEG